MSLALYLAELRAHRSCLLICCFKLNLNVFRVQDHPIWDVKGITFLSLFLMHPFTMVQVFLSVTCVLAEIVSAKKA